MLQEKRVKYPLISILQISTSPEHQAIQPLLLDEGAEVILPRPDWGSCPDDFVAGMTDFLLAFRSLLEKSFVQPERLAARKLKEMIATLTTLSEPPAVARELLNFTSGLFERAVTLVTGANELTAEKGFGITGNKSSGPTGPLLFKLPLGQGSVLDDVIEKRRLYYGSCFDPVLKNHLYAAITAPSSPKILILPLVMSGRVIALFYADFGQLTPTPVLIEHLDILSRVAGLVLDNSYYLKKIGLVTR
jgi:hypothetical protein